MCREAGDQSSVENHAVWASGRWHLPRSSHAALSRVGPRPRGGLGETLPQCAHLWGRSSSVAPSWLLTPLVHWSDAVLACDVYRYIVAHDRSAVPVPRTAVDSLCRREAGRGARSERSGVAETDVPRSRLPRFVSTSLDLSSGRRGPGAARARRRAGYRVPGRGGGPRARGDITGAALRNRGNGTTDKCL